MATSNGRPLKVWLDFVCPFCMLAEEPLAEAIDGLDLAIEWMPFELREEPTPTLRPEDEYLPRIWKDAVYPMAARLGVPIRLPTISPQPYTRLAFQGMQFARAHGKADAYVAAVLRAFFLDDRDIGDRAILADIAAAAGLPKDHITRALDTGAYAKAHAEALDEARALGINSVPSMQFGDRRYTGVPDPARLRRALVSELAAV